MVGIGFSLQPEYDVPMEQVIEMLSRRGFCAVSPGWSPALKLEELAACVKKHHMLIQSMHAPHKHIDYLWQPDSPEAIAATDNILRCVEDCARFGIPVMVMHCWKGVDYTFPDTPLDYRCFDRVVETAGKLGVCVAFENLEGEEYLAALMERYRTLPQVGFCWDSGHDLCYPHKTDFLQQYADRLIMTHLNDNFGIRDPKGHPCGLDDLHFLPLDGKLDWEQAMARLASAKPQKILNFELKKTAKDPAATLYADMSTGDYFNFSASRAKSILRMYASYRSEKAL